MEKVNEIKTKPGFIAKEVKVSLWVKYFQGKN
jgi:hypothetical protein